MGKQSVSECPDVVLIFFLYSFFCEAARCVNPSRQWLPPRRAAPRWAAPRRLFVSAHSCCEAAPRQSSCARAARA